MKTPDSVDRLCSALLILGIAFILTGWFSGPGEKTLRHTRPVLLRVGARGTILVSPDSTIIAAPPGHVQLVRVSEDVVVVEGVEPGDSVVRVASPEKVEELPIHVDAAAPQTTVAPPLPQEPSKPVGHRASPSPPEISPSAREVESPPRAPLPAIPRLQGVLPSTRGGLAVFPGAEARPGQRVGAWTVVRILDDAVVLQWKDRRVVVPVQGKASELAPDEVGK